MFDMMFTTISKLGFGCMRLPQKDGAIDQAHFNQMVDYAMENGVNYFDTSFVYHGGESETAIGIALEKYPRDRYYLADKMSFWSADSEEYLEKAFNTSCKKLKTDYIDFYLLHSLNDATFSTVKKLDAIKWAAEKKKQGKIKKLGFSIHAGYDCLVEILDSYAWDFVQIQYNYLDEDDNPGKKGYDELVKRKLPIIIMEPLKGGVLTDLPEEITAPYIKLGKSNPEMAFAWLAEKANIVTILSGVSNIEQLKQNIEIFKNLKPLGHEENTAIQSVRSAIKASQKVACTACRYCMPCPVGIAIPQNFKAWNLKAMQKNSNWISGTAINKTSLQGCINCGVCSSRCPQSLDIPQLLKTILSE